jgi:outer membrane protein OmpA-like peptidoglycan-associated protein
MSTMLRDHALAVLVPLLAACGGQTPPAAMPPVSPHLSEAAIIEGLPSYQSPGPTLSEGLRDTTGHAASLPDGVRFAESVVDYEPGSPAPAQVVADPRTALGAPDYVFDVQAPPRAVSLGNGGTLVLRFGGAGLGDAPGPDLFVFEIGAPEALEIALSDDGKTWRDLGRVPGGAMAIDVAPVVREGEAFHLVRVRDVRGEGPPAYDAEHTGEIENPSFAGVDIDAVGVRAGEIRRLVVAAPVLFGFDEDKLSDDAPAALDEVLREIAVRPGATISIEGHTDEVGTREYNQGLSERRAQAVARYLASRGVARGRLAVRGFGADRPVTQGLDEESRRRNRRVEIVIRGN